MIASWSHSRAVDFEKCRNLAFLKYAQRIPEPPRPLRPGQTEHANDRGTRVHEQAEAFTRGTGEFPKEARTFRAELEKLRDLHADGRAHFEGEWGFNRAWEITPWRGEWIESILPHTSTAKKLPEYGRDGDVVKVGAKTFAWIPAWLRMKLDALVFLSPQEAIAIDYKTGKVFGNEIKHGEQLQLYQLACFLRFPELEVVHTELWYFDHDELTSRTFQRHQGLRFKQNWDTRGNAITTCLEFPPNPNRWSCQYCPYGKPENGFPEGTGHCAAGKR